jgi:phosphatidylglycerol:prolipoprotein diacylglycerol transferase
VAVLLDAAALCAALGQAVGRVGNLINGDVVGYPSSLPWATVYTNAHTFARPGVPYEPAAAYELLFDLVLFGVLWWGRPHFRRAGTLFLLYLVLYAAGQFLLFYRRDNPLVALDLKQAQLTSLVVLAVALPVLLWWRAGPTVREGGGTLPAVEMRDEDAD